MLLKSLASVVMLATLSALAACGSSQRTFDTPEAAVQALETAVAEDNQSELRRLFGPNMDALKSGDAAQDHTDFIAFASKLAERTTIQKTDSGDAIILLGEEQWPFPVPLVLADRHWRFDTDAGINELANRRIGENELATIDALHAFVDAEREYQSIDRTGDGVRVFTARLLSTPGQHDGLFWETTEHEQPSPIGPVMAMAMSQTNEAGAPEPYYGYLYKALTRQGSAAPGGAMDYIVSGRLVHGIAAVAFPAEHGRTGVMTFIVSMDGVVYQRDLGPDTASVVAAMDSFDPVEGWTRVTQE